jgi:hypothetical protein
MAAVYPINSFHSIVPSDGPPTSALRGVLGQVAVDVNTGAYYQRIRDQWYPLGSGPVDPVLTTLTGNASVDNSPADGVAQNNVTFDAKDQNGDPMGVLLTLTSSSTTANFGADTVDTNPSTGTATTSLTNTVAEGVMVNATDGSVQATVMSTFT